MTLAVGARIGAYEILEPLGAGGMGEVYRARDAKLNRDVAIKVLPELFSLDRDRLARFQREAHVLASLNHQNIGHIYGLEDARGTQALVLELVEGPTLADRIAQGPVPLDDAIPIAKQIADALECAHEQGIIHRDLKPANIKLRPDGAVKVLDFGLAKALDPIVSSGSDATNSPTLTARGTQLGVIVGTAAYMAPEQARGRAVDRRADIWAFGVVLYEMLSGKRAFEGDDVSITLAAVLKDDVDWKALPPHLPAPVVRVLRRCLEKDPKRRLSAVADARLELETALQPMPEEAVTAPPASSRVRQLAGYAAVLLAGFGLGAFALMWRNPAEENTAAPVEFAVAPPLAAQPLQLALSPDGRALAFFAREAPDAPPKIWIRRLDSQATRVIAGTEAAGTAIWSPDSQRIAFAAKSRLWVVDARGGVPLPLCGISGFAGGTWNRDGEILFSDGRRLLRVNASGGEPAVVFQLSDDTHRAVQPKFLDDGKRFLYTLWEGPSATQRAIYVASPGSPPGTRVVEAESFVETGGDHLLYVNQGVLYAHRFDSVTGTISGGAQRLYSGVLSSASVARAAFTASADGRVVAFRLGTEVPAALRLKAWNRGGKLIRELGEPGAIRQVRLSPDGKRIALEQRENDAFEIFTMDVATAISTRLTYVGLTFDPVWSADSRRVAYGTRNVAKHEIFVSTVGDSQGVAVVTSPEPIKYLNDWSPDGKVMLFHESGGAVIYATDLSDGKTARKVFERGTLVDSVRFSPDGRRVAFQSVEGSSTEVFVADYPSFARRTRVSSNGGMMPRWRRDGRELYYLNNARMLMAIPVGDAAENTFGVPMPLFSLPVPLGTLGAGLDLYDVSADGSRFFAIAEGADTRTDLPPITVVVNWLSALGKQ